MFSSLIKGLVSEPVNAAVDSRRRYPRRKNDNCVCIINGIPHPVENWSMGGVLVQGDGRLFRDTDQVALTMKFKVGHNIVDIQHDATVVRKSDGLIAFQFTPLPRNFRQKLHNIIDRFTVNAFSESQSG